MAYSNSQQIFIDVLGRLPTEDEQKEIRSLLGILQRAGFQVDDPSNAAHVTLFAWGWARSTSRSDVLALLRGSSRDVNTTLEDARKDMSKAIKNLQDSLNAIMERSSTQPAAASAQQINAEELAAALKPLIGPPVLEVHKHYDMLDSLKKAAGVGFSWAWAGLAAVVCTGAIAYGVNAHLSSADTIAALRAENAQLQQQAAGAARRAEHNRP